MNRRECLKTGTAALVSAFWPSAQGAASGDRIALVIGNAAYRQSPLGNPVNDATAMTELFGQAGFKVESLSNAVRSQMADAMARFVTLARLSTTRQVFFYYAGHGVQLDWRNYLLGIDADVSTRDEVRARCVDLAALLSPLATLKEKVVVVILDACRDDPFGASFRPAEKGLSQFDAPPGTLLAYSTSPGKVASDGAGKHGLYTGHLVRELSVRGAKIEDVFKRVRLGVRLASAGSQIPWETTSLESDLYLFEDHAREETARERAKDLDEDIAAWEGIKESRRAGDWIDYLKRFPNGRFAEIAELRLSRLPLQPTAVPRAEEPLPVAPNEPVVSKESPDDSEPDVSKEIRADLPVEKKAQPDSGSRLLFVFGEGQPIPQPLQESQNPSSAGRFPLGRKYSPGDEATYQETDLMTGTRQRSFTWRVFSVDEEKDQVWLNGGRILWDSMGNFIRNPQTDFKIPRQFTPNELFVGKKWRTVFRATDVRAGDVRTVEVDFRIAAREAVKVPAGLFRAFRLEGVGTNSGPGYHVRFEDKYWVLPWVNFFIKYERVARATPRDNLVETTRQELVSLRQRTAAGFPGRSI